jgi:hypothetical protein
MSGHDRLDDGRKGQPRIKIVTERVVPVVALVVAIVAQATAHPLLKWIALGALLISLVIIFYPTIASRSQAGWNRWRHDRLARKATPEFKRLLSEFVSFVGRPTQACDTLHEILLGDLRNRDVSLFERLGLLPVCVFSELHTHVELRMNRKVTTLGDLTDVIEELNLLVMWFCSYCSKPVFSRFAPDLRNLLTDEARSSVEEFRQRFVKFVDDYSGFLKGLEKSLSRHAIQRPDFCRPKPL